MFPFWVQASRSLTCFHSLLDLCYFYENRLGKACRSHNEHEPPWETAAHVSWRRPAQLEQGPLPITHAYNNPGGVSQANPSRPNSPSQHTNNIVFCATKFYSFPFLGIIIVAINNKTHDNMDPLAMAAQSVVLRKIHIGAKQKGAA